MDRHVAPQPVIVEMTAGSSWPGIGRRRQMLEPQPAIESLQPFGKAPRSKHAAFALWQMRHRMKEQLGALGEFMAADAQRRVEGYRPAEFEKRFVDPGAEHLDVVVKPVVIGQTLLDPLTAGKDWHVGSQEEAV